MVTARVPIEIKNQATKVFESLGLTASQAINTLFKHVADTSSIPDFRSQTQIAYEGCPRILDLEKITPDMIQVARAMKSIQNLGPVDWGKDTGTSYKAVLEGGRRADYEALL
ncbi:MAG: type II toxin-antitoxin system RelB/DinJ family antitoxin [Coriobacteriia bacterium]|nr:type II toxin-antitoxin system RelB/DinJ family antitoxin [Coriobacteriia bacterium]